MRACTTHATVSTPRFNPEFKQEAVKRVTNGAIQSPRWLPEKGSVRCKFVSLNSASGFTLLLPPRFLVDRDQFIFQTI